MTRFFASLALLAFLRCCLSSRSSRLKIFGDVRSAVASPGDGERLQSLLQTDKGTLDHPKLSDPVHNNDTEGFELFAIGDSHGHPEHLIGSLLATGKFERVDNWLRWKSCEDIGITCFDEDDTDTPSDDDKHVPFRIYVLGDIIDRGSHGLRMLLGLKALTEDATRGHLLRVLLGNHESMALRVLDARNAVGNWSLAVRRPGFLELEEINSRSTAAYRWLRTLDVLALDHGVLLCHGGLSYETLQNVLPDDFSSYATDEQRHRLVRELNDEARLYYQGMFECYSIVKNSKSDLQAFLTGTGRIKDFRDKCPFLPPLLSDEDSGLSEEAGVLWFRGYSQAAELIRMKVKYSKLFDDEAVLLAGTRQSCDHAGMVGELLGATVMIVAHTTHNYQVRYCNDGPLPIFAIDTNPFVDVEDYEQDGFQPYQGVPADVPRKAPQALRLTGGGVAEACMVSRGCRQDSIALYVQPKS